MQRLSTGSRFAGPGDEPALQSFVTKLDSQIRGMNQAITGVNTAKGVTLQAEDALAGIADVAIRLKDLALQATNENLTSAERSVINAEASDLLAAFSDLTDNTTFNGQKLLDGNYGPISVQTGANAGNSFSFSIGDARTTSTGGLAIYSSAQGAISAPISNLSINGVSIGASTEDGVSTLRASNSALAIVNAINEKSAETGVTAEVVTTERTVTTDFSGASSYGGTFASGDLEINNVTITGTISSTGDFISRINDYSSSTGVRAETGSASGEVVLIAEDGRNIVVNLTGASTQNVYDVFDLTENTSIFKSAITALSTGAQGKVLTGAIEIYSSSAISISGGSNVSSSIGFAPGNYTVVSGTNTANIDLSTAENADRALKILDATIDDISTLRAEIGAVHDRLDITAETLLQSSNSLEDTKTAVGGTDFANEIAKLVSAQLLQDANIASLTQANSQASVVSDLLSSLRD